MTTLPSRGGQFSCSANNQPALQITTSGTMQPGVYTITHNSKCTPPNCYDLDFRGADVSAIGVTIVLLNGASIGVEKGADVTVDPTHYPNGGQCPKTVPTDCFFSVYAGPGSASELDVVDNASSLTLYGTLYLVAGTVNADSNARFQIVQGQAIVNTWNVQSGNQTGPVINYDPGLVAPQTEVLRLAE
jgi:hypothetical protein